MPDAVRAKVCQVLMPLRHVAWGGNMNNSAISAYGYGTPFTAPAMLHAMDQLGAAQFITRLGLALDEPGVLQAGKNDWLKGVQWQELRRYVEDTLVVQDPMELFVAQNYALDGQLYPLIYGSFVDDHVVPQGGTAVAMLTAFMPDWHAESARWIDAVLKTAGAESADNQQLIGGWIQHWADRAQTALTPVAELALGAAGAAALQEARATLAQRGKKAGLAA
jgi:phenol hydroxylase P1 protein